MAASSPSLNGSGLSSEDRADLDKANAGPTDAELAETELTDPQPTDPQPTDTERGIVASGVVDAVDVYWRPGCGYCRRLLRSLDKADVVVRLHDIWSDEVARRFVAEHNRGSETVPTVAIGPEVWTNPDPEVLLARLKVEHPELVSRGIGG